MGFILTFQCMVFCSFACLSSCAIPPLLLIQLHYYPYPSTRVMHLGIRGIRIKILVLSVFLSLAFFLCVCFFLPVCLYLHVCFFVPECLSATAYLSASMYVSVYFFLPAYLSTSLWLHIILWWLLLTHQRPYEFNKPQWPYHGLSDLFFFLRHFTPRRQWPYHCLIDQVFLNPVGETVVWSLTFRVENVFKKKEKEKKPGLWDRGIVTGGPGQKPDWKKMTHSVR